MGVIIVISTGFMSKTFMSHLVTLKVQEKISIMVRAIDQISLITGESRDLERLISMIGAERHINEIKLLDQESYKINVSNKKELERKIITNAHMLKEIEHVRQTGTPVFEIHEETETAELITNIRIRNKSGLKDNLATLIIEIDIHNDIQQTSKQIKIILSVIVTGIFLILLSLYFQLQRFVFKPISSMLKAIEARHNGINKQVTIYQLDEMGNVAKEYNNLLKNMSETEYRIQTILNKISDGIITFNTAGMITSTNVSIDNIFGYIPEELNGKNINSLIVTGLNQNIIDISKGISELVGKRKTGERFPLELQLEAFKIDDENFYVGSIRDISERKKDEENLKKQKKFLELSLTATQDGVWDYDLKTQNMWFSPKAKQMLGYEDDELKNSLVSWQIILHPESYLDFIKNIEDYKNGRASEFQEIYKFQHKNGSIKYILMRAVYELNDEGIPIRIVGAHTDITEFKRTQAKAEESARLKSEFLANMSHEIRTPMHGIMGMSGLLSTTKLNKTQKKYLEAIESSSNALLLLINDILDFSKIEAGKLELYETPFNLKEKICETIKIIKSSTSDNSNYIETNLNYSENIPILVIGDEGRIRQIFLNLLSNAQKFTHKGSINIKVEDSGIDPSGKQIYTFSISDTGIGIPENKLQSIFNKFDQVDSSTTKMFGGTGLGLAICKQLCNIMGGDIYVNSISGQGSTFTFTIALNLATESMLNSKTEEISVNKTFNSKILLVDDNDINILIAKTILKKLGTTVSIAKNGLEALELFKKNKYDLIIMDCQMPKMDGYEATAKIRKIEKKKSLERTIIMAYTANAMKGDSDKCLEAGMDDYISKPAKKLEVQQKLSQWLHQ